MEIKRLTDEVLGDYVNKIIDFMSEE